MLAVLLRIGPAAAGGHPLHLFEGEETAVLDRAKTMATPDAIATIPPAAARPPAPAGITYIDLATARETLAAADGTGNTLRDLGLQLHGLLDQGAVGTRWRAALQAAWKKRLTPGVHLRTWLDVQDPELARLPWELLQEPVDGRKLAAEEWSTLVRLGPGDPPSLPERAAELRALFVVGCHPVEDAKIRWLEEQRSFLATVCSERHAIDFDVFEAHARSRTDRLKENLRSAIEKFRPHILHFVGHGRADDAQSALELYDASTGQRLAWTSAEMQNWLSPYPPRIAVLNACRTSAQAAGLKAPIEALASVAAAALSAGSACVIAMQHDIDGRAAAHFAEGLYGALVAGEPIDRAVVRGRKRIIDALGLEDGNWALPVCTLNSAPEDVLPPIDVIPAARRASVKAIADEQVKLFVGRHLERRSIAEPGAGTSGTHVRFVVGDSQMGKSTMARLVAEWRMLLGHRVIYLDCSKATGKAMDALEVMRQIRGLDQPDVPLRPQVYRAFADFNDTVNAVLANKPHGALPFTGRDDGGGLDRRTFAERGWERLCGAFVEALKAVARPQPLTVILDHLSRNNAGVDFDDFKQTLVPLVMLPIHRGELHGVSAVICAADSEIDPCGLTALRDACKVAELDDFMREDWELLAREFAVRAQIPAAAAEETIAWMGQRVTKPWKPRTLVLMRDAYKLGAG